MKAKNSTRFIHEKGDSFVEFAFSLPFLLLIFGAIGYLAWAFWVQSVADVVGAKAIREASLNQPGDLPRLSQGEDFYSANIEQLLGERSAQLIDGAEFRLSEALRSINFSFQSTQDLNLGDSNSQFHFSSGGLVRIWKFFGGPPAEWE